MPGLPLVTLVIILVGCADTMSHVFGQGHLLFPGCSPSLWMVIARFLFFEAVSLGSGIPMLAECFCQSASTSLDMA